MTTIIGLLLAFTVNNHLLFDFEKQSNTNNWLVVNDDVMGGRSRASLETTPHGTALFKGRVSLENNGGFSSIRCATGKVDTQNYKHLVLRLKGDGKQYQVRIREKQDHYYSFIYYFNTNGEWETIKVPLAEMYPSFRGRKLSLPNYEGSSLVELTFLIGNKKAESFELELQKAYLEK